MKSCALKVVLHRSLKRNLRDSATSRFQRDSPRSWPQAPLVVSIPTIAGRNELNTANGLQIQAGAPPHCPNSCPEPVATFNGSPLEIFTMVAIDQPWIA